MSLTSLQKRIETYSIEQLVDYIKSNHLKPEVLIQALESMEVSEQKKGNLSLKIKRSFNRMNEPLELKFKLFFLFFPFGIINSFTPDHEADLKRFKDYRFLKKVKQSYRYSTIGMLTYMLLGKIVILLIELF